MKIDDKSERQDKYGTYPAAWISGKDASPQKIQEWLFHNLQGYKFAVIFDCTRDESDEPEKETPIYFLDMILDEVLEYAGIDEVEKWLRKKKGQVEK